MDKIYAKIPNLNYRASIYQIEPINFLNFIYYGYKIVPHYDTGEKDEKGLTIYKESYDKASYDEITQLFIDRNNLQTLLAQSTANNAQASVDVENLKQQNAQLVQQIAQLQVQGGSNNG